MDRAPADRDAFPQERIRTARRNASYQLDRVGLRTQQVSNLVIGDPRHPDLTARYAQIQMRLKWDGSFEVYRIVARGVRLRGRLVHGKVSWGQIDKLLPPPSNKPFALPNFVLDVADSSDRAARRRSARSAWRFEGNGKLSGGFKGRVGARQPALAPGPLRRRSNLRANVAVAVVARRPHVDGPVTLDALRLPGEPVRHRRAAVRRQGELQRSLHQHRRQRADGDRDADRGRQRPCRVRRRHHLKGALGDVAAR